MARRSLSSMRTTVLRRVGNHSAIATADVNGLIADVHRDIAVNWYWSDRKREILIQTVAPYSAGTVAVTVGTSLVTGTGTAWTAAMVGAAIRIAGELSYFFVQAVNVAGQTLTLGDAQALVTNWVQPTASGVAYTIFTPHYAIPANTAVLLRHVRDWPLNERTVDWIDGMDPQRLSIGTPSDFALGRATLTNFIETRFVELWPVPSATFTYRVPSLVEPPDLVDDKDLPVCPSEPIEWRAASESAAFLHAKTGDPRWVSLAQHYWTVYVGEPITGMIGALDQAIRDDEKRYGLPRTLGDGIGEISQNDLGKFDWELRG